MEEVFGIIFRKGVVLCIYKLIYELLYYILFNILILKTEHLFIALTVHLFINSFDRVKIMASNFQKYFLNCVILIVFR